MIVWKLFEQTSYDVLRFFILFTIVHLDVLCLSLKHNKITIFNQQSASVVNLKIAKNAVLPVADERPYCVAFGFRMPVHGLNDYSFMRRETCFFMSNDK